VIPRYRRIRTSIFVVMTAVCVPVLNGQYATVDSTEEFNPIARGFKDLWIQAKAPFSISSDDAPWVVGGAVTFSALLLTDQALYDAVDPPRLDGTTTGKASQVVTKFGATYGLGVLAGFAGYGFLASDQKALETSYLAAEAFVTSGLWTQVLKMIAGRERPGSRTQSGGKWTGPFSSSFSRHFTDFDSFPSGHTSTAFSLATVFASQYSETPVVPIISYSLAGLVGVSRISVNRHWPSDVFTGAVIGYLCARQVLAWNPSELSRSRDHSKTSWILVPNPQQHGLSVLVRF